MTRIHFVRHGETDWNAAGKLQGRKNSELTALGREQADRLADRLLHYTFDRIISSSSKRAVQTAEILAKKLKLSVSQVDELQEINLGPWEGRLKIEIEREYPEDFNAFWQEPDRFALPGAETFGELQQRGIEAINRIVAEHQNSEILIVSHGAMIKSLLCRYAGRQLRHLWLPPAMSNCAHSIVEFGCCGSHAIKQFAGRQDW